MKELQDLVTNLLLDLQKLRDDGLTSLGIFKQKQEELDKALSELRVEYATR